MFHPTQQGQNIRIADSADQLKQATYSRSTND